MASFGITYDIRKTLFNWMQGLRNLSIENVDGSEWSGTIAAGDEIAIAHGHRRVPTRFLVTKCNSGINSIIQSDVTLATKTHFYVQNVASTSDFTGKILILP